MEAPRRPALGTLGKKSIVRTNIFPIKRFDADLVVYQYDVKMEPDVPIAVSRKLWHFVESNVRKLREEFKDVLLVYDGRKACYSTMKLCESGESVTVIVDYKRDEDSNF